MVSGYARGLIWSLFDMTNMPLPPYLLEIVLRDGRSFYIHSPKGRDEETKDMVLNVYDFRAIGPEEDLIIRKKLDDSNWTDFQNVYKLHPLLEYGRLRLNLDDILYCVEWMKRRWFYETGDEIEPKTLIGFEFPSA